MMNIKNILSIAAISTLLVACGGSSKDNGKKEDSTKKTTTCVYTVTGGEATNVEIGSGEYKDAGATAMTTKDNKAVTDITSVIMMKGEKEDTKVEKIDTSKAGVYTITYSSETCKKDGKAETAMRKVTVKAKTSTGGVTKENVLGTL